MKGMRLNLSQAQLVGDVTFLITFAIRPTSRTQREGVSSGATLREAVISVYDPKETTDRPTYERNETKLISGTVGWGRYFSHYLCNKTCIEDPIKGCEQWCDIKDICHFFV